MNSFDLQTHQSHIHREIGEVIITNINRDRNESLITYLVVKTQKVQQAALSGFSSDLLDEHSSDFSRKKAMKPYRVR